MYQFHHQIFYIKREKLGENKTLLVSKGHVPSNLRDKKKSKYCAVEYYNQNKGKTIEGYKVSIRSVADKFGITKSVFERRINNKVAIHSTIKEEEIITKHLLMAANI